MLRSGVGPAEDLSKLRIAVVADRRGVGRNYQNHPQLHFAMTLKAGGRMPTSAQHYIMTSQRFSSGLDGGSRGDLFHYYTGRVSTRSFGPRMAMVAACLYTPRSRGFVKLRSADPSVPPQVEQRLLSDPLDAKRMVMSVRHAERLLLDPAVRQCFEEIYLMPRVAPLKLINDVGLLGVAKAIGATAVLSAPARLRRAMIGAAIKPGRLIADEKSTYPISDDDILDATGEQLPPSLDLRHRRRRRSACRGRPVLPRLRRRRAAGRRCLGHAHHRQRQHQHADHHDRGAGRRIHAAAAIERDPEKWMPVFGKIMLQRKYRSWSDST